VANSCLAMLRRLGIEEQLDGAGQLFKR
jgi:hypothetical protein